MIPRIALLCGLTLASSALSDSLPTHAVPKSKDGNLVVGLCDGQTSVEVKGVKEGQSLSPDQARATADALMEAWKQKHPDSHWDQENLLAQAGNTPGGNQPNTSAHGATPATPPPATGQAVKPQEGANANQGAKAAGQAQQLNVQHQTYGSFGKRDEEIWRASVEQVVAEGNRIFHDAKALGGTIGVSCDMCHPNAANTHPETYPKYQVQLGRVALLRDMINWCIENPVRGKPLNGDDPKLKALEAFIYAQRKGVPLQYGKH